MIVDIEAFGYLTQKRAVKTAPRLTIPFARQGEFARLVRGDPRFDMELRVFLPRTYNLKAIADYLTGPVQM